MSAAVELAPRVGVGLACSALGVARATFYRALQAPQVGAAGGRMKIPSPGAISEAERQIIREELHAPQNVDLRPRSVFARLLDAGR